MTIKFLLIMAASAALGFAKFVVVALILPVANFGYYTSILGLATLFAMLLSFGLIEATTKRFPRLWQDGKYTDISVERSAILRRMALRTVLATFVFIGASLAKLVTFSWTDILLISGLIAAIEVVTVSASVARATGRINIIQHFGILRGILPFLLVVGAALLESWRLVILAEVIAALLVSALSALAISRLAASSDYENTPNTKAQTEDETGADLGGTYIFFGRLMSSSVFLGDRAFIAAALGATQSGIYGILALVAQVGQIVSGIVCQKIGPDIVKSVYAGAEMGRIRRLVVLGVGIVIATGGFVFAFLATVYNIPIVESFFLDRNITLLGLALACLAICVQFSPVLEFVAIAHDKEKYLLLSGATSAIVCYGGFLGCAIMQAPVTAFVAIVICARISQITVLLLSLRNLPSKAI